MLRNQASCARASDSYGRRSWFMFERSEWSLSCRSAPTVAVVAAPTARSTASRPPVVRRSGFDTAGYGMVAVGVKARRL